MSVQPRARRVRSSDPRVILEIAAEVFSANAAASLADVAAAAGVGRTTLHNRFPTREALLLAVAHDALDRCAAVIEDARLTEVAATPDDVRAALSRFIEAMIPLGPRIEFLLRQPELDLDKELAARTDQLDKPMEEFVHRAQHTGALRPGVPAWWAVSTLYALIYAAWEAITAGRLAPRDAAPLVLDTTLGGIGPLESCQ
ncbi:TetR family transcriptional regulator [Kribbella sp. CA-294648]|uniref:TetR family transcriptional regulator n=1 Tax=Kribbella sp. CA-294648 TaxID=3239948 RepID=UPI003D8D1F06